MKTYTVEYIGEGLSYTVIMGKITKVFKVDQPQAGIPEDMAAYLSNLKESNAHRARLLFNVTEDKISELLTTAEKPKVNVGIKKTIKVGANKEEPTGFEV